MMEAAWERVPHGIAKNPRNPDVVWRIYYADYTKPNGYYTVSNLGCPDPVNVPGSGIICVLQEGLLITGEDFYVINDGKWSGVDDPSGYVFSKKGYWVDDETFRQIQCIAQFDTDFFNYAYPSEPSFEFELRGDQLERVFDLSSGFANNPVSSVLWKIYYADQSTITNLDTNPDDASVDNVVCIIQYEADQEVDVVSNLVSELGEMWGDVFFINEYGRWQGGFRNDTLTDRENRNIPYSSIKHGYVDDLELCRTIIEGAESDSDFYLGDEQ